MLSLTPRQVSSWSRRSILFIRNLSRSSPRHPLPPSWLIAYAIELIIKMSLHSADLLECFCGRTYTYAIDLEEHRKARGHFPSHVCRDNCRHPPVVPHDSIIRKCGCCGKHCERLDILEDHCIVTGHCVYPERYAFRYQCRDCEISFEDIHAFSAHMAGCVHCKPLQQKLHSNAEKAEKPATSIADDQACIRCQRTFPSFRSLQQHRESLKHKPLSALRCPVGEGCTGKFSAPSALLHHLESGNCCSAMDRDAIYDIVHLYDHDCTIHSLPTFTPSNSPHLSLHRLSPNPRAPRASLNSLNS